MNSNLEILKKYFEEATPEMIKADWEVASNISYEGPTINEFLSETEEDTFIWPDNFYSIGFVVEIVESVDTSAEFSGNQNHYSNAA